MAGAQELLLDFLKLFLSRMYLELGHVEGKQSSLMPKLKSCLMSRLTSCLGLRPHNDTDKKSQSCGTGLLFTRLE